MSARASIVNALVEELKRIDGNGSFESNLSGNVSNVLRFYDELNDFPYVCVTSGYENREYLPGGFKWGFINISIKVYVQNEFSQLELEKVISDIESVIASSENLSYGAGTEEKTTEILITSIQTDEGVLNPIGVGEINIVARYQVL